MKKIYTIFLLIILSTFFLNIGCENEYPDSLWNPEYSSLPTPVVSDVTPDTSYSGIGIVTITGQNFSSNIAENKVFFNGNAGKILTATTTELTVQVPTVVADSILIQVDVFGAYLFGEYGGKDPTFADSIPPRTIPDVAFRLEDATVTYKSVDATTNITGLACDPNENIYTNLSSPRGIIQITNPDSTNLSQYSSSPTPNAYGMKWGPNGQLYLVRKNKNMYRTLVGGGSTEIWGKVSESMYDMDFDQNLNLFAAGKEGKIFRFTPAADTMTVARYGEDYEIFILRVYDGYLYSYHSYEGSDTTALQRGIWRNQILDANGTLGPNELMFDWDTYAGKNGPNVNAMVIDENGLFYLGVDYEKNTQNVAIVKLDIFSGIAESLYPEILNAGVNNLVWGNKNYLYIHRFYAEGEGDTYEETRSLFRLAMPVNSAPYYGRQ